MRNDREIVTMPLAPHIARAVDLAIGKRHEAPSFTAPDGSRLDRDGQPVFRPPG
jgi:hypothetical protein